MTQPDYAHAAAYVAALTGEAVETANIEWRALHDSNKGAQGVKLSGTLPAMWNTLCQWNAAGYGIFCNINSVAGGHTLEHITSVRAHAVDLDNLSAQQNYEAACVWSPAPCFAVATSPGKYHLYWSVQPYTGNDYATVINRKLRQQFDGDKGVIDPSRVLRVPGFMHCKGEPRLVTIHALAGYGQRYAVQALDMALAGVTVIDGSGTRQPLGEPSLAAPSLEWLEYALALIDPNTLSRAEWISVTSATKQSGHSYGEPQTRALWDAWCARFSDNDLAENEKQWRSIRETQLGWGSLTHRVPHLRAVSMFGATPAAMQMPTPQQIQQEVAASAPPTTMPVPTSEILTDIEQRDYFAGCMYVTNLGAIMTPENRFLNQSQFNATYGGKKLIIDSTGKTTDEAYKAATRSTLWRIPMVDHTRFVPDQAYGEIIMDDMKRRGVNTFKLFEPRCVEGDAGPFIRHIAAILPDAADQKTLLDYLAHNVRYPGFKIPWAPVIQSAEGAGKGVLKLVMRHCMGRSYIHFPNAKELADSGAKFNAWMRNKTFILADEIRVDDRRDMIETLKPMISESEIEIQAKGLDQSIEDNYANWLFFTNWHDAIPVNKNGRRFAVMYSAMQSAQDLLNFGMDEKYFKMLYDWLNHDGAAIVATWLKRYPIERGAIPMRAPATSSMDEAVRLSRGPVERLIAEAVEDALPGFRGGFVSTASVLKRAKEAGVGARMGVASLEAILRGMGYVSIGRAPRAYFAETGASNERGYLFALDARASVDSFGDLQGWSV